MNQRGQEPDETARAGPRPKVRPLTAALLANALSSPGRTFFIAVFTLPMAEAIGVSLSGLGAAYMAATIGAALLLPLAGPWIDRIDLRAYIALALSGLALSCVAAASAINIVMLTLAFLALRLTGQGLMPHIAATSTVRYFSSFRGRALAIAGLGFPLGEALSPGLGTFLISSLGWRGAYLSVAAGIVFVALPGLLWLLRREHAFCKPHPLARESGSVRKAAALLLGSAYFWLVLPLIVFLPFAATALIFHLGAIMEVRGLSPALLGPGFVGFAVGHVGALFLTGQIIDRFGAARFLPAMNWAPALGLFVLAAFPGPGGLFAFLFLFGAGSGTVQPTVSAMWAEIYGTRRMGSIRSLAVMVMVVSTAAGPLTLGLALDAATSPSLIALVLLIALVAASALAALSLAARSAAQRRAGLGQ